MRDHQLLQTSLSEQLGASAVAGPEQTVPGSSVHRAWRWQVGGRSVFVKVATEERSACLAAEADGLAALAAAQVLHVPAVLGRGTVEHLHWLALEWLDFQPPTSRAEERLGELLANQHRIEAARFGWQCDNYIGATPQVNDWLEDWAAFLRTRRLMPQLMRARAAGLAYGTYDAGLRLLERIDVFFASYRPVPSLLHGDLWAGNWGVIADAEPVVFDPASYYGDREVDLAMTRLFGGFGARFYSAYQATWPLDAAAGMRRDLYNLYHVLNHFNLFGGAYAAKAHAIIEHLLAETGA